MNNKRYLKRRISTNCYYTMFDIDPHGPCVACIPRFRKAAISDVEILPNNNFEFGKALEWQPHLLEYVFEYLDFASLQTILSVNNNVWKNLAERELSKRSACSWITCTYIPSLCVLRTDQQYQNNNKALGIFAYCPKFVKLEKYVCLHDCPNFFRMSFAEYLATEVVPDGVKYCAISCTDIPPANIENKDIVSLYQGIYLPDIPKMRILTFYVNAKIQNSVPEIRDDEHVKCLLVFTHKYRVKSAETFLSNLLDGRNIDSMAMGGGLIKSSKMFPIIRRYVRSEDLFCIAFTGEKGEDADFNAYSVVIRTDDETLYEDEQNTIFEKELSKLKEMVTLRKSGTVFRFCCYAKSFKDAENAMIEKCFPKYPLFSIDVDGEIGWNTINLSPETTPEASPLPKTKKLKYGVPQTLHGWSSVLVVITWGKKL
ncbi:hypothetical protein ILUMI_22679 [Ignelater luminosus]|uniref:F-box domain-containing protein n=1 Tax=Ignelater luminosus TaxID=2038154 RepID=A0A8K0CDF2_IGNLU|nr:hypothetical protein ILUMI_22679 [Ignelater luminosus]